MAVLLNCSNDKVDFLLVEELGSKRDVGSLLGEVDNGEVCTDGKEAGDETPEASLASRDSSDEMLGHLLHDEDPAPACETRSNALWTGGVKFVGAVMSTESIANSQTCHLAESVG